MLTLSELIDQLLNVRKLPTISNVALILEQSLSQEEPEVQHVSSIISDDPAITSMVLKLANSATYGARRGMAVKAATNAVAVLRGTAPPDRVA